MKRASGVEFIVMRHGQSEADLANPKIFEGRLDTKLTSTGLRQARLAADWMGARLPPTRIISSPMARAAMTADAIAAHVGLEVELFCGGEQRSGPESSRLVAPAVLGGVQRALRARCGRQK